jgi:putative SOS response-associated peptidase YedK
MKTKQPYFIHRLDGEPLAFAGLWETWRDPNLGPDAPVLHSCTIITTTANATMEPIHDRMPVILPPDAWSTWLDRDNQDLVELNGLLVPAPDHLLSLRTVSTEVNNVRNKGAELVDEADPLPPEPEAQPKPAKKAATRKATKKATKKAAAADGAGDGGAAPAGG